MVRLQGIIIIAFVPDSIDIRHLRIQIADAIRRSANPYNSGFIHTNIGYRITTQAFVIIPVIHIMVQKFSGSDIHAKTPAPSAPTSSKLSFVLANERIGT